MKTYISSSLAAAMLLLLPSCASSDGAGASSSSIKRYPLATCIVTDNELGSMGPVITKVYQNQEVKFCCKPCIKKFDAEPAKFLAKLPR